MPGKSHRTSTLFHSVRMPWRSCLFLLLLLFVIQTPAVAQQNSKSGGVCFRVDNNPSIEKLNQYYAVFQKYQKKFCLGISSWSLPINTTYVSTLRYFSSQGHEIMDNTPTHQTHFFNLLNIQDTTLYAGNWGVDHFTGQQVCLKYTAIDTTKNHNEGMVTLEGNTIISHANGEFGDLNGTPFYFALYLNPLGRPFLWYDLKNINPFDPDTLKIKSFWAEPVNFALYGNAKYHKLTPRDVYIHPEAIELLGRESLRIYDAINIPRPTTWVQPTGQMPWITAYNMKSFLGDSLGFTAGSTPANQAFFCYNEYNPVGVKQFAIPTGDISIENYSFQWNKNRIANFFAKHYVKVDLSYFSEDPGQWNAYLQRLDSLLKWCYTKNIPVQTYRKWSDILYDSLPGKLVNVFPKLNVDLDGDGFPDGFDQSLSIPGVYNKKDGVPESGNCSFQLQGSGTICQVSLLAGLEKGDNKFSLWVKRTNPSAGQIEVLFTFPETGETRLLTIPVDSTYWVKQMQVITVPQSVTLANIVIRNPSPVDDTLKISGMELRSSGFLTLSKAPPQVITANEPFQNYKLNTLVDSSLYAPSTLSWTIRSNTILQATVLQDNILKIRKPVSFWVGEDSLYAVALSPDGLRDSCLMKYVSQPIPVTCGGTPVQITLLDTLSNDIIQWSSDPYDSTISNRNIYNPIVSSKVTTLYRVVCVNPLGNIYHDSLQLIRFVNPDPGLPADTGMCIGDSVLLTATGGVHYLWSTGDTVPSVYVKPAATAYFSVWVTSSLGCTVKDSVKVYVSNKPTAVLKGLNSRYCSGDYGATLYGLPPGGEIHATSGLVGNIFTPSLADTGINKVWYIYTNQYGCVATDTVTVRVIPQPVIRTLPDTSLCGGRSIVLHAGPGFDNYLWTNGATDSITTVDSVGHGLGLYRITVYVTKEGCAGKATAKIKFIVCPGMEETVESSFFTIFPNPASDRFTVEKQPAALGRWMLKIYNHTGSLVHKATIVENTTPIDVSGFSKGLYLLVMSSGERSFTYKLVCQ